MKRVVSMLVIGILLCAAARAEAQEPEDVYKEIDGYVLYDLKDFRGSVDFDAWDGEHFLVSIYPEKRYLEQISTVFRLEGNCVGFYVYTDYMRAREYLPGDISTFFTEVEPEVWKGTVQMDPRRYGPHFPYLLVEVENEEVLGIHWRADIELTHTYLPLLIR